MFVSRLIARVDASQSNINKLEKAIAEFKDLASKCSPNIEVANEITYLKGVDFLSQCL